MTVLTPQEYFNKIQPLRNPEEIKALCEELTSALFNESDKPKTRVNKLTPYNKLVREIPNEELIEDQNAYIQTKQDGTLWKRHLHFKYTGLADTKWHGEGGINTKTVVLDRLENRREIKVTSYLETTAKLLLSNDPHELAVGLIAASGRRPVEILARGSFKVVDDYSLDFKGQAKKRDYDLPKAERTEYRIGVLVPAEAFIKAFNRFRKMPETKELLQLMKAETKKGTEAEVINDMIESRRGNSLRRVVSRAFGSFLPARFGDSEINNKSLRAAYVRLITDRDCPKSMADLLWASRSVGHFIDTEKPDDNQLRHLLTTLGYYDYYCDSEVPFMPIPEKPKAEKTTSIRAIESDVEIIRELQGKWDLPNQQSVISQLLKTLEENKNLKNQLTESQAKIQELQHQIDKEKQQNTELIEKNAQLEEMNTTDEIRIVELIEQVLDSKLQQLSLTPQTESSKPVSKELSEINSTLSAVKQPKADETDYEGIGSEELKEMKSSGAAKEKIRRSFKAICDYNDHQPSNETRWVINNQSLRQLSGCNGLLVKDWMKEYQIPVNDHNSKYSLGLYHNKRHKNQVITEVISW